MRQQVFKVWQGFVTGRWYWHLISGNGKMTCAGQPRGYASERGALKGIESVREGAPGARIVIE